MGAKVPVTSADSPFNTLNRDNVCLGAFKGKVSIFCIKIKCSFGSAHRVSNLFFLDKLKTGDYSPANLQDLTLKAGEFSQSFFFG